MSLTTEILTIGDWKLPVAEITQHLQDWGDLILIRTKTQRFALKMPSESRALWELALTLACAGKNVEEVRGGYV